MSAPSPQGQPPPTGAPAPPGNEPATTSADQQSPPGGDDADSVRRERDALKATARKWEQQARENATKAKALDELEAKTKSAEERLTSQVAGLTRDRDDARAETERLRAGIRYKLDEADLAFIPSGTAEEMDAAAKRLAERIGAGQQSSDPPPNYDGGARPSASGSTDMNDLMRSAMRRAVRR
jgi:hypothetical protein